MKDENRNDQGETSAQLTIAGSALRASLRVSGFSLPGRFPVVFFLAPFASLRFQLLLVPIAVDQVSILNWAPSPVFRTVSDPRMFLSMMVLDM